MTTEALVDAYFERTGPGRFRPSTHVGGAWNAAEQHLSPVAGLIAHLFESHDRRSDLHLGRISCDVLGVIPMDDLTIAVRTVRPGRTIELLEGTVAVRDRTVVRAHAWRLIHLDSGLVAGGQPPPMPAPSSMPAFDLTAVWDGGYIASLECRRAAGAVPGRGQVWVRSHVRLLAGDGADHVSPVAQYLRLADTANGIVTRVSPREWMFPNVDLTVHLFRQPSGAWIGFDTTVTLGADGLGLTSSWLHDEHGPVGRAEQTLTVRPLPASPGTVRSRLTAASP